MYDHTYLTKMIADSKEAEICQNNLNMFVVIKDSTTGDTIRVPYYSLVDKYRDILQPTVEYVQLSTQDQRKYKYAPKAMSEDLYGTTELAGALLVLNGMKSLLDFNKKIIKIYNPKRLFEYLNEILLMEGKIN